MRILLSTLTASPSATHGGPVVARRHAEALARRGIEVCIAAPDGTEGGASGAVTIKSYEPGATSFPQFAAWRPNARATLALSGIINKFRPDLVYDVHGPAWAVEAAVEERLPVVSMIGDYAWYCRQNFLLDSRQQRCSGPDSLEKCFSCVNRDYWLPRRMTQVAVKLVAQHWPEAPAPGALHLWDALQESRAYMERLRAKVDRFVVGDRHAETFFLEHGIPSHKLVRIAQCLPEDALVTRRSSNDGGMPAVDRALRIGFVGRPHLDKGLHILMRAFQDLPESARVELWIIHAHWASVERLERFFEDRARFRMQVESGRIRLYQPESRRALYQLMADIDVGVIPSLAFESPSLVMLEFVAQGTPIVRSESAGMEHVIQDDVNGRTFPYGDWAALKEVLLQIIGAPTLLDRWRSNLPEVGHDAEYARELVALFSALTAKSGAPHREVVHA